MLKNYKKTQEDKIYQKKHWKLLIITVISNKSRSFSNHC